MKSVTDLLNEMASSVKVQGIELLSKHSRLKETDVVGPDHLWQPLELEGQRIRSKLYEDYERFFALLAALLHKQTPSTRKKLEQADKTVRGLINQNGFTFISTTERACEQLGVCPTNRIADRGMVHPSRQ